MTTGRLRAGRHSAAPDAGAHGATRRTKGWCGKPFWIADDVCKLLGSVIDVLHLIWLVLIDVPLSFLMLPMRGRFCTGRCTKFRTTTGSRGAAEVCAFYSVFSVTFCLRQSCSAVVSLLCVYIPRVFVLSHLLLVAELCIYYLDREAAERRQMMLARVLSSQARERRKILLRWQLD